MIRATVLLAVLGAPGLATAAPAPPHALIARIEADLRPVVVVRGRPPASPRTLAELMAANHLTSVSVAVVDHGKIAWAKAWGLADVASNAPATPRTLYEAGSVSKPVAASAAMRLVEERRIVLDRPVNDQLKSWKIPDNALSAGHPVTLRHLLTHTGGLTVHGFPGYSAGAPVPSVVQVLEGKPPANTAAVVVEKTPGSEWSYSGGGITIAQLLMTEAAGESFPQLTEARVFGPVGMADSTYAQPLPAERAGQAATGYYASGSPVAGRFHTYPEMAAAGLWTTPSDLAKWAIALQRAYAGQPSTLMSRASARAMLTPGLGEWGLGIQVTGKGQTLRFAHNGDDIGFKASLVGYLQGGRAIVAMTNGDDGAAVIAPLVQAIARAYGWKGLAPEVVDAAPLTAAQRQELVGSYGHGILKVTLEGDEIQARFLGGILEIIPQGGDKYLVNLGSSTAPANVTRDSAGRIKTIVAVGYNLAKDP